MTKKFIPKSNVIRIIVASDGTMATINADTLYFHLQEVEPKTFNNVHPEILNGFDLPFFTERLIPAEEVEAKKIIPLLEAISRAGGDIKISRMVG